VFSPVALASATLISLSGAISALAHIGDIGSLFRSTYGQVLIAKLCVVLAIALLGWRNWKYATPALATQGAGPMQRGMRAELIAAAIVLLVTAALVVTPPPMDGMVMP
jgi:putative copper export protein